MKILMGTILGFFRRLADNFSGFKSRIAQKILTRLPTGGLGVLILFMVSFLAFLGIQYLREVEFLVRPDIVNYDKAVDLYQNSQERWSQFKVVDYYQKALLLAKDSMIKSKIAYNIGTMLLKGEIFLSGATQTEQAIGYLKEALRQNPGDMDAAYNLEIALLKEEREGAAPQDPDYGYPGPYPGKGERGNDF